MRKLYLIITICFTILISTISCNKDEVNVTSNIKQPGDGTIVFNIAGVEDTEDIVQGKLAQTGLISSLKEGSIELERQVVNDESNPFVAIASVNEMPMVETNQSNKLKPGTKSAATKSQMANNIKYRILIFDNNDNFLTSLDASAGVTPRWTGAFRNTTYKWKAYSYNSDATITPSIPENPTDAQLSVAYTSSQDFLYDSGIITTNNTQYYDNPVNILFKRQRAAIELVISTRGMYDRIKAINGQISGVRQVANGTFNLKNGTSTLNTSSVTTSKSFTLSDFRNLNESSADTIKTMYIYTLDNQTTISNYTVKLSSITFHTDISNRNRTFTSGLNFAFNKSFVPVKGKRYKIIIDFLTGIKTITDLKNSNNIVNWSLNNLYYDSNRSLYGIRNHPSNIYGANGRQMEFFNWKALTPGENSTPGVGDPCTKLYPSGRFRMPTPLEFSTISNLNKSESIYPRIVNSRSADPIRYVDVILSAGNNEPYYYLDGISLLMYGKRKVGSLEIEEYNTNFTGSSSLYYWTSKDSLDYAEAFKINSLATNGVDMTISSPKIEKLAGLNIRCVENRGVFNASNYPVNIK